MTMNERGEWRAGFIRLLIVVIVAIILLSYFNVDLRHWVDKLNLRDTFQKLWALFQAGWAKLADLWHYLTKR